MGGEWSLGVALVNEVWPGKSRAVVAGLIGAAANVGYLLVAILSMVLLSLIPQVEGAMLGIGFSQGLADHLLGNSAWRLLMISGALPAILIFLIFSCVPESEKWEEEKRRGGTSHWERGDLFGVAGGSLAALVIIWAWTPSGVNNAFLATLITIAGLAIAGLGYLYPVKQYLKRSIAGGGLKAEQGKEVIRMMLLEAGLGGVALLGTWGSTQWASRWAAELQPDPAMHAKEWTLIWLSLGAITGTMGAALAAGHFGRRITYAVLCVGSIAGALDPLPGKQRLWFILPPSAFIAGAMTASFYGFFPLYLPELFPTAVRATGQGFAFNFGRIVAAVGGLQTANLMAAFGGSFAKLDP